MFVESTAALVRAYAALVGALDLMAREVPTSSWIRPKVLEALSELDHALALVERDAARSVTLAHREAIANSARTLVVTGMGRGMMTPVSGMPDEHFIEAARVVLDAAGYSE